MQPDNEELDAIKHKEMQHDHGVNTMRCSYTEALDAGADKSVRHRLLANRSLAYWRAGRFADALADADAAAVAAPGWDKGYWRRGEALAGLKHAPQAVTAYHRAWQLSNGERSVDFRSPEIVTTAGIWQCNDDRLADGQIDNMLAA